MPKLTVDDIARRLKLEPLPGEGGYYRETYRSAGSVPKSALPDRYSGDRSFSTAIYYMLTSERNSSIHRLKSDEVWHFYLGGPITIVEIEAGGVVKKTVLGPDIAGGELLQYVVPAGRWFGAYPNPGTEYTLVGCTISPGFDFADFELGDRDKLLKKYPDAKREIELLT